MYVNPEDDKVKQLHSDIGRTLPKENLKLGQKMKSGGTAKFASKLLKKAAATKSAKATERRGGEIKKLYEYMKTLRENALPSEKNPEMIRQLSNKEWKKKMRSTAQELDALLKKDGAEERLSPSRKEAVTYGAPLSVAAKELYFPEKKKSGGKVKKYGYMGGGKVYAQPRKANYKAG